jgi:hypothetical protein
MAHRGTATTYISRVQALRNKHALLSAQIEEAQRSPSATDIYLQQLKKQRLVLKEEIEGIRKAS